MASCSTVLTCIQSVLDDLAGLMKPPLIPTGARALRFQLRNLKAFVLCSRKLVNDDSLRSLLLWIEDVVRGKAKEIAVANYSFRIGSLEEEMQDWYITMFDHKNCDLMSTDELLELMGSILEILVDIYGFRYFNPTADYIQALEVQVEVMRELASVLENKVDVYSVRPSNPHFEMLGKETEALQEQMLFLKCLVQICDPETSGDLMAHAQDVAVNAAYLIFASRVYKNRKGISFDVSCLVQKIKPIDPQVYEIYTRVLRSRPSPIRGVDIMKSLLDSLIYNLWDILLQLNTPHLVPVELDQLQQLYEGLRSLRTALRQPIEGRIKEGIGAVVCDAGVLICSLYQSHADLPLRNLLESINTTLMGLTSYGDAPKTAKDEDDEFREAAALMNSGQVPSTITYEMVGLRDDFMKSSVCNRLRGGSNKLQVISIVGLPRIGKTTFALEVFNDASISNQFSYRAWCDVSQVEDQREMLLHLLKQNAHGESFEETGTEEYLEMKMRRCLKMRRYLIFLDDVWCTQEWESLKVLFPDDCVGSRIILTSRVHVVAPHNMLADSGPHIVLKLSRDESLELLHSKLLPKQSHRSPEFDNLAKPFLDLCKGLPLSVALLAAVLKGKDAKGWKVMMDCLVSSNSLNDLSYKHLPHYLKSCFLYFATFPKDGVVSVWRLLRLWIAEGFVQKHLMKTPEDVAESYLHDLINRSLVEVAERKSDGGIKTCRIQGQLHDYCTHKARDEMFFHSLKGYDELSAFNEQPGLLRLRIESKPEHLRESKLFCPRAGSLLFSSPQQIKREVEEELLLDISFLIRTFKFLHVLDIEQINVGHVFPSELEMLVQLAFVAIRGEMRKIPSSVAKLSKLETLIVDAGSEVVALPDSLESLFNLQFLYIKSSRTSGGATLPATNLENSCVLEGLGTFYGVVVPSWGILGRLMKKYPNIRKLKCRRAKDDTKNAYKSVNLEFLSQLESLHLSSLNECLFKFRLPANLRKLTLSGFHMVPKKMSSIGKLPNLEVLKLLDASFEGNTWELLEVEEEFQNLRALKLHSPGLVSWRVEEDCLRSLEKLVLNECKVLVKVPEAMGKSSSLQVIDVSNCSRTVVSSVKRVWGCRKEIGNEELELKVFVDGVYRVYDDLE